jgi:hypothetical protein
MEEKSPYSYYMNQANKSLYWIWQKGVCHAWGTLQAGIESSNSGDPKYLIAL